MTGDDGIEECLGGGDEKNPFLRFAVHESGEGSGTIPFGFQSRPIAVGRLFGEWGEGKDL